jgi:hypothetical protein
VSSMTVVARISAGFGEPAQWTRFYIDEGMPVYAARSGQWEKFYVFGDDCEDEIEDVMRGE